MSDLPFDLEQLKKRLASTQEDRFFHGDRGFAPHVVAALVNHVDALTHHTQVLGAQLNRMAEKAVASTPPPRVGGQVTWDLTPAEVLVMVKLLRTASEAFTRKGCNEFLPAIECGLTKDEEAGFWERCRRFWPLEFAGEDGETKEIEIPLDWFLMQYLAERVASTLDDDPSHPLKGV